jgi:hypothetical protein
MADHNTQFYGFTAVPRSPDVLFKDHPTALGDHPKQDLYEVNDFPLPDSTIVREVKAFVKVRSCISHHQQHFGFIEHDLVAERTQRTDIQS